MTEDLILLHGEITEREIRKMFVIFLGAQSVAWLTARLAKTDLRIATFPPNGELRGLATTRDRSSGDVVLEVSDSDIFSSNNVLPMQPALLREATRTAAAGRLLTDDHLLPLLLLLARDAGPTDPWSSYVDALPDVQPSPLTLSAHQLVLLPTCYAQLARTVDSYARHLHAGCESAIQALIADGVDQDVLGVDSFVWAHGHVRARSLPFGANAFPCVSEAAGRHTLIPALDLLNHSPMAQTTVERGEGSWRLVSETSYQDGEQVFISYGRRDNLRLWLQFGFALRDNPEQHAAFDASEIVEAVSAHYQRRKGDAWPHAALGSWEHELLKTSIPSPVPLHPAEWMREHLYMIDLARHRASDKLNEALVRAVLATCSDASAMPMVAGVASFDAMTDAILVRLLRARADLLQQRLSTCEDGCAETEPLQILMTTEREAALDVLAAINAAQADGALPPGGDLGRDQ